MKKLNKKQKALVLAIDILENVLSNMDDDDYDTYTTGEHCWGVEEIIEATNELGFLKKKI